MTTGNPNSLVTVLLCLLVVGLFVSADAPQGPGASYYLNWQLWEGGIRNKEVMLRSLDQVLRIHVEQQVITAMALAGNEQEMLNRFEIGLKRALEMQKKMRTIIEKVYEEEGKK